jgi:hypothetical protein
MIGLALLFETRSSLPGFFIANQLPSPCYCKEHVAIYRMKDWKEEADRILKAIEAGSWILLPETCRVRQPDKLIFARFGAECKPYFRRGNTLHLHFRRTDGF